MALYDYKCNECEHIFERFDRMSESGIVRECPECKSMNTARFYGIDTGLMAIPPDRLGRMKVPEGFREVLRNIADKTPGGHVMHERIR